MSMALTAPLLLPASLALALALPAVAQDARPARAALDQGQSRQTMILLRDRLQQAPDDRAARRLLLRLYLDLGQGAAAAHEIERLRAADDAAAASAAERDELAVQLGAALLLQGQFAQVLKDTDPDAVTTPAAKAELTAQRGEAELGRGAQDAAQPLLRAALELDPANSRALIGLARLAFAQADPATARTLLQQVMGTHRGTHDHDAWELLGELDYLQGDLAGAEAAFTAAMNHSPAPWQAQFKRAMTRIDRDDPDGAAADIAAARASGGRFPGLDLAAGSLALHRGDPAAASPLLERYLRAVPGDRQGVLLAGLALARQGQYAQAEQYLDRLRTQAPADPAGAELTARILLARGKPAEAQQAVRPISGPEGTQRGDSILYRALLAQGRRDEALVVARRLTQRQPREPRFALALAAGLSAAGNTAGAKTELERLLKEVPDALGAHLALVRLDLQGGQPAAALAAARALAQQYPQNPRVDLLLGQALAANGDTAGARAAFTRALADRPGFQPAALALAALAGREGDPAAARAALEALLKEDAGNTAALLGLATLDARADQPGAAVERLRHGLAGKPQNLRLRLALAQHLVKLKDRQGALAVLAGAPPQQAARPMLLRLRGELELATGSPTQALQSFTRLAAADPQVPAPHYLLAMARAASGDREGMEQDLTQALRLAPDHPLAKPTLDAVFAAAVDDEARAGLAARLSAVAPDQPQLAFRQGRLALRQGHAEAAQAYFRAARQQVPGEARYQHAFTDALVAGNRIDEAIADAQTWLSAHPDDAATRTRVAEILMRQGRDGQAQTQLRALLQQRPGDPMARNNLAMLLLKSDPKAALAQAELAYAALPGRAEIADTLGAALLADGQSARALEVLRKAQGAALSNPGLAYHYAQAMVATGNTRQAERLLSTLTGRDFPEQEAARALLARLQAQPR